MPRDERVGGRIRCEGAGETTTALEEGAIFHEQKPPLVFQRNRLLFVPSIFSDGGSFLPVFVLGPNGY